MVLVVGDPLLQVSLPRPESQQALPEPADLGGERLGLPLERGLLLFQFPFLGVQLRGLRLQRLLLPVEPVGLLLQRRLLLLQLVGLLLERGLLLLQRRAL